MERSWMSTCSGGGGGAEEEEEEEEARARASRAASLSLRVRLREAAEEELMLTICCVWIVCGTGTQHFDIEFGSYRRRPGRHGDRDRDVQVK
jgi:hypothetical protein